jgi:hypothetical protein
MSICTWQRRLWGLLIVLYLTGCGDSTGPEPAAPLIRESAHFEFVSSTANASTIEIETGIQQAEAHFTAISNLVGASQMPSGRITVILEGDKQDNRPGGYVDGEGAIHLSRYREDLGGYFSMLAHELAHALRYEYWHRHNMGAWQNFGFIEEGFAEFVALRIHPDKTGFPFYSFPEDVIAGHWLIRGEAIPLRVLRENHDELNNLCEWQAYPERASWFRFIDEAFGREAVLAIAYSDVETSSAMIEGVLGTGLEHVDAAWEQWLLGRYAAIQRAEDIARDYWDRFGGEYTCAAGVDY